MMSEDEGVQELYVLGKILVLIARLKPGRRKICLERASTLIADPGDSDECQDVPLIVHHENDKGRHLSDCSCRRCSNKRFYSLVHSLVPNPLK